MILSYLETEPRGVYGTFDKNSLYRQNIFIVNDRKCSSKIGRAMHSAQFMTEIRHNYVGALVAVLLFLLGRYMFEAVMLFF